MRLEVEQHGVLINAVAANAAEASRTADVGVKSASAITFSVSLTHAAATALSATLYKSVDGGATYTQVHSVAIASGAGTASEYTVSETVTGDDTLTVDLDVSACTHVRIIVAATGGDGASDFLTVRAGSAVWG